MMIPHHQQVVEMAALAESRAADSEVKRLAGQIKTAQDPEIKTMTGWLSTWGKPAPTTGGDMGNGGMNHGGGMPGVMSDADMVKLKAATGKDFDKQFCTMMIAHHQGAIATAKDELASGTNGPNPADHHRPAGRDRHDEQDPGPVVGHHPTAGAREP